jgi:hypothetical protein
MNYNNLNSNLGKLNKQIDGWQKYYNEKRLHKALKDKNNNILTPMNTYKLSYVLILNSMPRQL